MIPSFVNTTVLGPFGRWPWKYRVVIADMRPADEDEQWKVRVERRTPFGYRDWSKVNYMSQKLYEHGQEFVDRFIAGAEDKDE